MSNRCFNRETPNSSRREYIQNLQDFTERSRASIEQFTKDIGWVQDDKIPKPSQEITEKEDENDFSEEPLLPCMPLQSEFTITIDAEKQRELLRPLWRQADLRQPPSSAGELTANFTKEERIALYEYALKKTPPVAKPPELLSLEDVLQYKDEPSDEKLTSLEMKKALRDFKRRRQAYRTKVSTKNKSQTQVTREIINNMMVFLGADEVEQGTNQELQSMTGVENQPEPVASRYSSKRETEDNQRSNGGSSYKRSRKYKEDSKFNIIEKKYRKDYKDHHFMGHGENKYRHSTSRGEERKRIETEIHKTGDIYEPISSTSAGKYKAADERSRSKSDQEKPEAPHSDDDGESTNSRDITYKTTDTSNQESEYRTKKSKHKRKSKKSHKHKRSKSRD